MFNTVGFFQFHYYSIKDNKNKFIGGLPFDTSILAVNGK